MIKEQFSPVSKILSPKPAQGRNLVGSARHIRDLTADIHANIQQWNTAHLQGLVLLKEVTLEKRDKSYSQTLQELCDKLENICDSLETVVKNLAEIMHQIKITISLEKNTDKLFTTWPTAKFGEVAESIYNAYSQEMEVKKKVVEDIAHYYTVSLQMLFLATWVHQPLLPPNLTTVLESLLIETGHR
ncbi:cyclin-dependent kinase 2-interacting protein-like [Hylaeus anthracinus]|uniref:cyclin-dependent kinase 2-interacting protein-like n=1 Tax=Hylaeus volcanicus TaxID=313075 RepID=UPI0023B7ED7C|nr:cyclin-dependent kinase 2-interacting protein-like [Hylaeus volcanicus]XP_054014984.1 cyclin-dependent kinase 2-interacting protein-like [Hylaeus anthracinus]